MPTLQKHVLTCTNTTVKKLVVMRIFSKSHGLHREVYSVPRSHILFAVLLMNMSYTLSETCNSALDIYTLPSTGGKTRVYNFVKCPVFTAHVDGFLDYVTVLTTGGLNLDGYGRRYGVLNMGMQYRNGVYIAPASQGGVYLDTSYRTRTLGIKLDFLQGDEMRNILVQTFVSFTYAYVQICISCR